MLRRRVEGKAVSHDFQHRFIVALGLQTVLKCSLAVEVLLEELSMKGRGKFNYGIP